MKKVRIVIFAKAPVPGMAKTRLIPALGEWGAAALARRMLDHAIAQALLSNVGSVELCMTPSRNDDLWDGIEIPDTVVRSSQGEGALGERLARASQHVIEDGESVVLIGTDCPELDVQHLQWLADSLSEADAAMIPAADGGYVALGLNRFHPLIFSNIAWSTDTVAFDTLCRFGRLGWSVRQLPMLHDIDEPDDLKWLPKTWHTASVP